MQATENVRSRTTVLGERTEETLPLRTVNHATLLLNGRHCVGPLMLQLCASRSTYERRGIATTSKPMLLLPTRKSRSPKRNLLDDGVRHGWWPGISTYTGGVGELCVKPGVSRTICDAPRTDALGQLLNREHGADVDVASPLATTLALSVGSLDAPSGDWVWMILERRQTHSELV